ncbi:hypothetical protein M0L22_RS11825 [Providencia rettgeri]|nr:hypothetical protein [Providencia rettgeri]
MREVKPTQKPVPSSDIKDLFFNSGLLDIWATSLERKYIDRFGNCHLTAAGMEWIFNELVTKFKIESEQALLAAGYAPAGTFQEGAEVVSRNGTVLWKLPDGDGEYYRWDGDLPKQVPAGSTPQSTGGIGKGAWVSVGDASLRGDIRGIDGISHIGATNYEGVRVYKGINSKIKVYGRENVFDGCEGEFVLDLTDTTSEDDGGTVFIDVLNRRWKRVIDDGVYLHWFVKNNGMELASDAFKIADKVCSKLNRKLILQGEFFVNEPIVMHRSATESSGLYVIEGAGDNTVIYGEIDEPNRAVLEITGESNPISNRKEISNFKIRMRGGSKSAYCLKVGDVKESFKADRIICQGANALLMKTGLSSWAQMGTLFVQCSFRSNYNLEWGSEETAEVFAVNYDGTGAKWDNVVFLSCQFAGLVEPRASVVDFIGCNFLTSAKRPTTTRNFANNLAIRIGSANVRGCYFEDHRVAIEVRPQNNIVNQVTITGCRFSGVSNTSENPSELAIEIAGNNDFGSVSISDCYFADTDANGAVIYQKGSIRIANARGFVSIDSVSNYYKPSVPIRILKEAQNFSITNNGRKAISNNSICFSRIGMRDTGVRQLNLMGMDGITQYTDKVNEYYINGITASFNFEPAGNFRIRIMINDEVLREMSKASFDVIDDKVWGFTGVIARTIKPSDKISVLYITEGQGPEGLNSLFKIDVCY